MMLQGSWFEKRTLMAYVLLPLSFVFSGIIAWRKRRLLSWLAQNPLTRPPIVIIGNIRVGGVGKTPLLIYLVQRLQAENLSVGVISRGYGGTQTGLVKPDSAPSDFGDEPVLIAQSTHATVVVHADRRQAVQMLLKQQAVDIILSDDGLQHYRLPRDYEVVVMDARGVGNGFLLPAGPLREAVSRLQHVNHIVMNQSITNTLSPLPWWERGWGSGDIYPLITPITQMHTLPLGLFRVLDDQPVPRDQWQQPVYAVCGIGFPPRFFASLQQLHLNFEPRVFADHHAFVPSDLPDDRPVVMTQKDAVKVRAFATPNHWYLRITVQLDQPQLLQDLLALCEAKKRGPLKPSPQKTQEQST
jgi:tetraacyldisaccharide 4'-kinase